VPGQNQSLALGGDLYPAESPRNRVVPGNVGGVNWGSGAYDPKSHLMIVNTNRLVAWSS